MLTIRPFTPADADGVASIILPIQQREFGIGIGLDDQPDLRDIPGFYQRAAGNFWVADMSGVLVGTIGLLDIGHGQAALRKMFVAEHYRGREHGTAQRLLEALLEWSRFKALTDIYLGTTDKFVAAHRFYERNGFAEIAKSELPGTFPVMTVDSKFYHRPVVARGDMNAPVPTLYEWLGGLEALNRLTTRFYERVQGNAVLAPVFAHMPADHPQHVAAFLAEVLGGPARYSAERGGHPHMVQQHLNRHLTQAQRREWVALLLDTADELKMPDDPEFRSALVGYLEWGSRLAVLNSQPGATVDAQAPMPKWGWGEVKGPYVP